MKNMPKLGYYSTHPEKSREFHLLLLTKSSDAVEGQRAKNQLILDNEAFLKAFIRDWVDESSGYDRQFLLQEARIAFLEALETFDLDYGTSIRTYARYYLLKLKSSFNEEHIFSSIHDETFVQEGEVLFDTDAREFTLTDTLEEAFQTVLTPIEAEVIRRHFLEGQTMQNIADARYCSKPRISTIVKKALPKLKKHLISIGVTPAIFDLN